MSFGGAGQLAKISPEVLHQRWMHSHEEDTDTEMVFRPGHYVFPPSRGRIGFDLKSDGTYTDIGIAPTDGSLRTEGTWQLLGDNALELQAGGPQKTQRVLQVVAADSNRLIVKK